MSPNVTLNEAFPRAGWTIYTPLDSCGELALISVQSVPAATVTGKTRRVTFGFSQGQYAFNIP